MGKIYLESYLHDIETAYAAARSECTELWDKLEAAERKNSEIQNSRKYSREGKEAARSEFEAERDKLTAQLNKAVEVAQNAFGKARAGADAAFGDLFSVRPEQVDDHALELLKADILTNAELVEMAQRYQNNPAMRRLCGKYAELRRETDPTNAELRHVAANGKDTTPKHLEGIDTLTMWAGKGLRVDNRMLSDGIAAQFDGVAAEIIRDYGGISTEL